MNDSLEKTDRTWVRIPPAPLKKVRNKNLNDIYNKHIGRDMKIFNNQSVLAFIFLIVFVNGFVSINILEKIRDIILL